MMIICSYTVVLIYIYKVKKELLSTFTFHHQIVNEFGKDLAVIIKQDSIKKIEKINSAYKIKNYKLLVDINIASQAELERLPGIGPVYAKRIIEYREKNNGFKTIEELVKIKGIGSKRLNKIRPYLKK